MLLHQFCSCTAADKRPQGCNRVGIWRDHRRHHCGDRDCRRLPQHDTQHDVCDYCQCSVIAAKVAFKQLGMHFN